MDIALSQNLPQLLDALFQQIHVDRRAGKELPTVATVRDKLVQNASHTGSLHFHVPNQPDVDSAAALDTECDLIALARDFATEAIRLYAGELIAARSTCRNQSNVTYRLPVEVLSAIFEYVECTSTNSLANLRRRAPLNLSGVSRFWREVACNTPSLWARIDAVSVSLAPLFARRSMQLPLQIELVNEYEGKRSYAVDAAYSLQLTHFTGFIRNLVPCGNRWKSLALQGIGLTSLSQLLRFRAPLLENLYLILSGTRISRESTVSRPLFGGETPHLRVLRLVAMSLPLRSKIYVGLVELHLERINYTISTAFDLLRVLEACPSLERLTLRLLQFETIWGSPLHPSISLRCLKHLELYMLDHRLSDYIISSIIAPVSVRLRLEQGCRTWSSAYLPIAIPNSAEIGNLLIRCRGIDIVEIAGNAVKDNACLLELDFRARHKFSCPPIFLEHFGRIPPFVSLKSLAFEGLDDTFTQELFIALLGNFPSIETLSLRACPSRLLGALASAPNHTPCPMLHTLQLADMHLDESVVQVMQTRVRRREADESGAHIKHVMLFQLREEDRHILEVLKGIFDVVELSEWVVFK
ncbi:hypothetical protein BOTBODRAFT_70451 [Botryobasidium botryosum FD-172 SS1]|uniref:F-box domain-containing protein n=1 Tax=Botryobasidium botryosum (strain FD-172 SS1) TaxID=930990 RepID=A0A067LY45_BOTB1|nr:hypothetical protein BOTBODRAFT_70451 [Botryobasidium botryosum FD-172 SS1]